MELRESAWYAIPHRWLQACGFEIKNICIFIWIWMLILAFGWGMIDWIIAPFQGFLDEGYVVDGHPWRIVRCIFLGFGILGWLATIVTIFVLWMLPIFERLSKRLCKPINWKK